MPVINRTEKPGLYPIGADIPEDEYFMDRALKKWKEFEEEEQKKKDETLKRYINYRKAGYSKRQANALANNQGTMADVGLPEEDVADEITKETAKENLEGVKIRNKLNQQKLENPKETDTSKQNAIRTLELGALTNEDGSPLERESAEQYLIEKFKVDTKDPEIQAALQKYPERTPVELPETTPFGNPNKPLFGKYPKAHHTKYNRDYEKREDGKWHLIE